MRLVQSISLGQARRLAIGAQGLATPRPPNAGDRRHLRRLLRHTGLLQIDSVNVLTRAHYLPGWSRLGAYPRSLLDRMAYRDRELFEYWGHEASLLPIALHPLLRWRMRRAEEKFETWGRLARLAQERPGYVDHILQTVTRDGPMTAGELAEDEKRGTEEWGWNWTDAKTAVEFLFWTGAVTTATRRGFERVYDVTDRVLPPHILAMPTPDEATAHRELLLIAARAHGVATVGDTVRYPDAVVTCTAFNLRDRVVPNPVLVFEVISPTSGRIDRVVKLREYAAVPTIRRYMIVESDTAAVTMFSRDRGDEPFRAAGLTEEDTLHFPEIGIEIPVAALYEGIAFEGQDPPGA